MYITTILDKYQIIYLDYMNGSAATRVSVPIENRKNDTIISYLDYDNLLHVELFVGANDNVSDEEFAKDINWVTTQFIYKECYNLRWNADWNTTISQIDFDNRQYHMVISTISTAINENEEEISERITQRYSNICTSDEDYYNEENWELYDYNIIINDIINIITDLMIEVDKYDYQISNSNTNN